MPKSADVQADEPYNARTPLGRKLVKIRAEIVASGEPLLPWESLEREIADRRGESGNQD